MVVTSGALAPGQSLSVTRLVIDIQKKIFSLILHRPLSRRLSRE